MCIRIVFHTSNSSSTNFSGWYFLHMFFGTCEVFPKEAVTKKKITENIIPITTTHHKTAQIFWIYHLTCVALIFRNWSCLLSYYVWPYVWPFCMTLCYHQTLKDYFVIFCLWKTLYIQKWICFNLIPPGKQVNHRFTVQGIPHENTGQELVKNAWSDYKSAFSDSLIYFHSQQAITYSKSAIETLCVQI